MTEGNSDDGEPVVYMSPRYEYTYTPLENITSCGPAQVNIYGVVKCCTSARKARAGTSYYTTVSLHNQTLYTTHSVFTVCLFADQPTQLPCCDVGDVLRLNHVTVQGFNGSVNGMVQMFVKGCWLLFKEESTSTTWDFSSKQQPCWNDTEAAIVTTLRDWSRGLQQSITMEGTTQGCADTPSTVTSDDRQETALSPKERQETALSPKERQETTSSPNEMSAAIRKSAQLTSTTSEVTIRDSCRCGTDAVSCKLAYNHVLCRIANNIRVCPLEHGLSTTDVQVNSLNTKLLVNGLPHFSLSELHSIQQSGAHRHAPFLCRTTCHILPTFESKPTSCRLREEKGTSSEQVVLYVYMRDTEQPSVVVSAVVDQANLALLCGIDKSQPESAAIYTLVSRFLPTCKLTASGLTADYVNSADIIVESHGETISICYTRLIC